MNDEKAIDEIKRLRRQLRMMWITFGAVSVFVVASIVVSGVLLTRDRVASIHGTAVSLRIGPSANGDSLMLTGDGFILMNRDGKTLAQLKDTSDQGPLLAIQRWVIVQPNAFDPYAYAASLGGKKPKTAPAASTQDLLQAAFGNTPTGKTQQANAPAPINSETLTLSAGKISMETAGVGGLALYGGINGVGGTGTIYLWDRYNNRSTLNAGNWSIGNTCNFDAETCYENTVNIGLGALGGLSIDTCQKHNGMPLSDKNKDQGCTSLWALSHGNNGVGANISIMEDGVPRLTMGATELTSKQVGGTVVTPASQVTAFDKKGNVIWKIPPD